LFEVLFRHRHPESSMMDLITVVSMSLASVQSQVDAAVPGGERELIPREVLFGNPERTGVKLSPDGSRISYLAPHDDVLNVWVMPAAGGEAVPVTRSTERPIRSYSWGRNSEQILYANDEGGDENTHIYAVGLDGGEPIDLTPGEAVKAQIVAQHRDRPDEILVMTNAREPQVFDIQRLNTRTGESTLVFENDGGYVGMVHDDDWVVRLRGRMTPDGGSEYEYRDSPDGAWIEFDRVGSDDAMTTQPIGFTRDGSTIWMIDSRERDTAALTSVTVDADGRVERDVVFESPISDVADSLIDPETLAPQAIATDRLRREWNILDDSISPDLDALARLSDGELDIVSRTRDDRTWIVAFEHDDGPARYWVWDRDGQEGRYLFSHRPELEDVTLSKMRGVEIPTRDGLSMPSYLTVPHDSDGTAVPLILLPHGGPWARDHWGYNGMHQWLADRGYAVLSPNFRGSTGFGKAYLNAGNREWYGAMQDDLVDAVRWAVDEGVADPDRVAIMGGSYGGYATLAGMTRDPELFACGVDIVGPSHVGTLLSTIPAYWEPIKVMFETRVGSLDEPEWLDRISPLTHVDNIQKPLLIGQGANDPRVKVSESDQIVAAMDAKGIPVTYVVFPDEGHGFARPENMTAFSAITEAFLAKHLGGEMEPVTDELAKSTAQMRRLGNLVVPGAVEWVPEDAGEVESTEPIRLEDLDAELKAMVAEAMAQIQGLIDQVAAQQGAAFDEGMVIDMVLQQLRSTRGQVPDEQRPAFDYMIQELEARSGE
jgi:dipeptidyl aminopeptidase/acylaminoacyl peptidase